MRNPELFTAVGIADGTIVDRHSGKLAPVGTAKRDSDYAFAERSLEEVRRFDRARLGPQDQITYDILEDFYGSQVAFERFDWLSSEGLYPISPMFGTQISLVGFMQTQHVVKNEKTARNYVARLRAMGDKLDARDRRDAAPVRGRRRAAARAAREIAAGDRRHRQAGPCGERAGHVVRRAHGGREGPRRGDARGAPDAGGRGGDRRRLSGVPTDAEGPDRGAPAVPGHGGGHRPARGRRGVLPGDDQAVHDDRLHARAGARARAGRGRAHRRRRWMRLLDGQGLTEGTVAERIAALRTDPRFLLPNDDAGREQMLAQYREMLDAAECAHARVLRDHPARQARGRARAGVGGERRVGRLLPAGRARRVAARNVLRESARRPRDADLGDEDARLPRGHPRAITSRSRRRRGSRACR